MAAADFAGDGTVDLVINSSGSILGYSQGYLTFLKGQGDGTFVSPSGIAAFVDNYAPLRIADINADGLPDVIVSQKSFSNAMVLLGNGNGTFAPGIGYGSGRGCADVAVGDLNGDGLPDIVTADLYGQTFTVLFHK